ncbi:hypothetical protein [Pedococcus sp.]|uniref:hypothetical protein n=1 Tax=Pedococcus sp. TaxID=2860345 RepID=UPI002E113500|nr:hypothetical protein [Pedococcus sp.]
MTMQTVRWWRPSLVMGATAVILALTACGSQPAPSAGSPSPTGMSSSTATGPCHPLPPSEVPGLDRAVTQAESGTYCGHVGVSVLVVLKAPSDSAASRWTEPVVSGPAQGAQTLAAPLTALRGTTVAAVRLTKAGTYRLTSTSGHTGWSVSLRVS